MAEKKDKTRSVRFPADVDRELAKMMARGENLSAFLTYAVRQVLKVSDICPTCKGTGRVNNSYKS